jgi:hypothetical protein
MEAAEETIYNMQQIGKERDELLQQQAEELKKYMVEVANLR